MTLAIRGGRVEDAAVLAELARRTFREAFGARNDPEDLAQFLDGAYGPAQQAAELASASMTTFLASVSGELAGFAQLRRGPAEACVRGPEPIELQRIYALRAFHGARVGAALMDACLERARADGFRTIWLGVWENNPRAQAFYRKYGFVPVGSHPFVVGRDVQTDVIYERPLTEQPSR